jgi:chemotaxis signal transduction protein
MVCFRTGQGRFALPVESTLSVRKLDGLVGLPAPRDDIVGVLPGDPPLTVLSSLGAGGDLVLVVISDGLCYGLHVLEVVGVSRFPDDKIGPPPKGQRDGLIVGTLCVSDELVLVADASALAARL